MSQPVALVVGGSSGIGAAVAARLTAEGTRVAISSANTPDLGRAQAADLEGARYFQSDANSKAETDQLITDVIDTFGRLDTVVYSAGRTQRVPFRNVDDVTEEMWDEILQLNLVGAWWAARAAAPHLRATGAGNIVLVGSLAGIQAGGSSIPYAVSKAALHHMGKLLAVALSPEIRVNVVAPGFVETRWTAGSPAGEIAAASPLGRVGQPEEVAELVLALMRSTYVTGQVVAADGGFQLRP